MDAFFCHYLGATKRQADLDSCEMVNWKSDASYIYHEKHLSALHLRRHTSCVDAVAQFPSKLDDGTWIVGDVLLDNRQDLLKALQIDANSTHYGDDYLVLLSYKKWGIGFLNKVKGAFAFVIWDKLSSQLIAARDPIGRHSCFYHYSSSNGLFLSSTMRPLVENPSIPKKVNEEHLLKFSGFDFSNKKATIYSDIHKVHPGHFLKFDGYRLKESKYWIPKKQQFSAQGFSEQFKRCFISSVENQLDSSYPIGAHLSGGLDSTSVALTAAKKLNQTNRCLHTFSSIPGYLNGKICCREFYRFDDSQMVQGIINEVPNLRPHFIEENKEGIFEEVDSFYPYLSDPFFNPYNRLWMTQILTLAKSLNIRAMLTGTLGNFTISRSDYALSMTRKFLSKGKFFLCDRFPLFFNTMMGKSSWQKESLVNPKIKHRNLGYVLSTLQNSMCTGHNWLSQTVQQVLKRSVPMDSVYALEAVYGVQERDPTAHVDLFEMSMNAPKSCFIHKGRNRGLIRKAMEGIVPKEVLEIKGKGAQSPTWYQKFDREKTNLERTVREMIKAPLFQKLYDQDKILALFADWSIDKLYASQKSFEEEEVKYHFYLIRVIMQMWLGAKIINHEIKTLKA